MKNLKALREEKGLSQQKLATYFNLSQQSIYKYENNLAEPDLSTLQAFADFFEVSVDYLIGYSSVSSINSESETALSKKEEQHIHNYRNLPKNMQSAINTLMQEYLKK